MHHTITINTTVSFIISLFVLLIGYIINQRFSTFKRYSIPEPIVGGIIVSIIICFFYYFGISINFSLPFEEIFMLMFFSALGLSADLKQLRKGGVKVAYFSLIATLFIIGQNTVGISISHALGLDPLFGLIAGSITLTGGHGTGAAWAPILESNFGIKNAMEATMACATFGLIIGGVIGGPVANTLIKKHHINTHYGAHQHIPKKITSDEIKIKLLKQLSLNSLVIPLLAIIVSVMGANAIHQWVLTKESIKFIIPSFIYALFIGIIIRNFITITNVLEMRNATVSLFGNASLNIFLAMALLGLELWSLVNLAVPILFILLAQTFFQIVFSSIITFRAMGKNYDAAVIAGGHCGFGMGSTATAVMNMNTIVNKCSPSPQAFFVVPIVGAFFIDIINMFILQFYLTFIY
ncbi:sodium/glutamate symporter [Photobacterium leiognathi]|uniref:sodium/glutamate symporter n=1 Tax=Photobacterium leiognathi TaxID=553611 RepID=UPI0027332A6F|nr:sodium/glutamate symporter [Photobacterium leiognathi]